MYAYVGTQALRYGNPLQGLPEFDRIHFMHNSGFASTFIIGRELGVEIGLPWRLSFRGEA